MKMNTQTKRYYSSLDVSDFKMMNSSSIRESDGYFNCTITTAASSKSIHASTIYDSQFDFNNYFDYNFNSIAGTCIYFF
jgi:hypothetical protein